MGKRWHLCTRVALAGLLCLGAAPAAIGCGFHSPLEVQLESMYPGSLPVAVALRRAADRGVIDAAALEAPHKGAALYVDTVRHLQAFRKVLAESPAAAGLPATFSLGYVESRLWTRYSQAYDRVPAAAVIHYFRTDRPGQRRGIPEITPALPLFAQLRRYTLAVIAAA